jgi:hypothetical protein
MCTVRRGAAPSVGASMPVSAAGAPGSVGGSTLLTEDRVRAQRAQRGEQGDAAASPTGGTASIPRRPAPPTYI